jgi:hypothetical protein
MNPRATVPARLLNTAEACAVGTTRYVRTKRQHCERHPWLLVSLL